MSARVTLVTGFPTSFLAVRVVRKILVEEPDTRVVAVVQPKSMPRADEILGAMLTGHRSRVTLLEGDVASMDLGLSGKEFMQLAGEVDVICHLAAVSYLGADEHVARPVNVQGVREILELAHEAKHLRRLVHWSTALVSGARRGYVLEEELSAPDGFRNIVEQTRFEGERLIRLS
jgi:thioester reductase-like protein